MEKAIFYPFLMFIFAITMIGGWIPTIKLWSQETFRLVISFCAGILSLEIKIPEKNTPLD